MRRAAWIVAAASLLAADAPGQEPAGAGGVVESPITAEERDHWSFRPLRRPPLPAVRSARAETPIDLFVLARLESAGLSLQPPADDPALRRRLTFDLTGLPPGVEPRPATPLNAGRLFDRLASSPAYGERWAQHWLDLARFAETDGFEHDKVRKQAWQYRDWVIAAWNRGTSYDRFITQQLAGDLLGDPQSLVATLFCTSGPDMPDINSQQERKHDLLNEMTGAVGAVMMGLQIGCAQCHDHKYDPISQADFYRLRALFEPAVHVQRNRSIGPLVDQPGAAPARLWIRGDWRRPGPAVPPAVPRVINLRGTEADSRLRLARWLAEPDHPLTAHVIVNRLWQHHFGQGLVTTPSDFGIMGDPPTHPQLLDYLAAELVASGWNLQRLQRMIVTSATYQQASRLAPGADADRRARWQQALQADPRNELLSRFPRKRLDGEAVRDAMLAASGSLDRRMGGPGVRPPLPPDLLRTLLKNQWEASPPRDHYRRSIYIFARRNLRFPIFEVLDRPDANASCPRRPRSTTAPQALLLLNSPFSLDAAKRLAGRVARDETGSEAGNEALAGAVIRRALAREATGEERQVGAKYLREHAALLGGRAAETLAAPIPPPRHLDPYVAAALTEFSLAILNCNEFLYLD